MVGGFNVGDCGGWDEAEVDAGWDAGIEEEGRVGVEDDSCDGDGEVDKVPGDDEFEPGPGSGTF